MYVCVHYCREEEGEGWLQQAVLLGFVPAIADPKV